MGKIAGTVVCVAGLLVILYAISLSSDYSQSNLVSTNATVLSTGVITNTYCNKSGCTTYYDANVNYTYTYDNKTYQESVTVAAPTNFSSAEQALSNCTPNSHMAMMVSTKDPSISSLPSAAPARYGGSIGLIIGGIILFIVGIVIFFK